MGRSPWGRNLREREVSEHRIHDERGVVIGLVARGGLRIVGARAAAR